MSFAVTDLMVNKTLFLQEVTWHLERAQPLEIEMLYIKCQFNAWHTLCAQLMPFLFTMVVTLQWLIPS